LDGLLDSVRVGHIGLVADGHPLVIPTAVARDGDELLVHGSTGSPWMRNVADGQPVCVSVTAFDAIIVARCAFESSFRYRSATIFGRFQRLKGDRKLRGIEMLVEKALPGRVAEVRPHLTTELERTMVLSLPIEEWSFKVSDGWPNDGAEDVAGPAWAGVVPVVQSFGDPMTAPDLRDGVPLPPSVMALLTSTSSSGQPIIDDAGERPGRSTSLP
jgi:nitroimidazol reductase NimA-like FMN-containing flavoprotein (pyridoxamine 5'-phosphate oxidase superfamily)